MLADDPAVDLIIILCNLYIHSEIFLFLFFFLFPFFKAFSLKINQQNETQSGAFTHFISFNEKSVTTLFVLFLLKSVRHPCSPFCSLKNALCKKVISALCCVVVPWFSPKEENTVAKSQAHIGY